MKKILSLVIGVALVAGVFASYVFIFNPVATLGFVSVDINPSVQFVTDEDDKVVGVSASNEDGDIILLDQVDTLLGMSIEEATEKIIALAIEYGYLDPDALETDPGAVTITTMLENENERAENVLREKIKTHLESYFKNNGVFAVVLTDVDMEEVVAEAAELGISAGELKLIKSVQAVYPEFTTEEGIEASVKDMMDMLKDLRGVEQRVQTKLQYVQTITAEISEITATLESKNSLLVSKEADLSVLNATDITGYDETALAEHNVAIEMLEEEITVLEAEIATLEADLLDLNNDLTTRQAELDEVEGYLEDIETTKNQKMAQAQTKYENWLQNREQKANQISNTWEHFEENLTEEQRQNILDYFNNYFSNTTNGEEADVVEG